MAPFLFSAFGRKLVQAFSCFAIMFDALLEMFVLGVLLKLREKRLERRLRIAHKSVVQLCAPAELFSAKIDLDNRCVSWEKLLIRKVSANHEQGGAVHHGVVTGGKSEKPSHADMKRVVVLDELLPAQRMHDRGVEFTS